MVRLGGGALLAGLIVATLAGCGTAAAPLRTPGPSASVPAFPRLPGRELAADEPAAGDWRFRVAASADVDAAYARARALLTDAGYTLTKDRDGGIGGDGQACTERLCVDFTATDDPDAGPSVLYEVFRPAGIVG